MSAVEDAGKLNVWSLVRQTTKLLASKGIVSTEEDEQRLYTTGMEIFGAKMGDVEKPRVSAWKKASGGTFLGEDD